MPRPTEIIQAEEIATPKSPLRRSCRIVAVSSPVPSEAKPIKGRRLSSNLDKDEVDQKITGRRASSVTKDIVETKTEPAKTRSRRLSSASDSSVIDENKPGTRTRSSQLVEDAVQETSKPIRRRRSSATYEEAPKPVRTRRSSATSSVQDDTEQLTRGKTDSKQEEADQQQRTLRSRRSASRDLSEDNGETKRVTRSRRSSTETLDEIPTNTPIKSKQALSVVLDTVLEDSNVENKQEIENSSKVDINKMETDKTNLDLSIIYETSFAEEEKSKTIQISNGEIIISENTAVRKSPRLQEKIQKCQFGEHTPHKKCSCMDGINSDTTNSPKHKRSPQDLKIDKGKDEESTSKAEDVSSKELAIVINRTQGVTELSKLVSVEGETEGNTSNTSESSNKENVDEERLSSKNTVMIKTVVNRISNVFRPKNIEYSFSEPMDVDTTIDLNVSKFDKSVAVPNSNETAGDSFSLKLSATYIEIPEEDLVTETSHKSIEVDSVLKELKSDSEDAKTPEKSGEKEAEISKCKEDSEKILEEDDAEDDVFSETKDMSDDYEFNVLSDVEKDPDPEEKNNLNTSNSTDVEGSGDKNEDEKEKVDENIEKFKIDIVDLEESQQDKTVVAESIKELNIDEGSKDDSDTEELIICEESNQSSRQNETVDIETNSKDDSINVKSKNDVEEIDIESEDREMEKIEETNTPSKQNAKELENDTKSAEELKADQSNELAEVSINVVDKNDHMQSEIDIESISSEDTVLKKDTENKKSDVEESELKGAEPKETEMECTEGENVDISKIEEKQPEKAEEINPSSTDAEHVVENSNNEETIDLEAVESTKSEAEKSNEDAEVLEADKIECEPKENFEKSVNEDIAIEHLDKKEGGKELVDTFNVENDVKMSNNDDENTQNQENVKDISNEQIDMEKSFQDTIQDDDDLVSGETVENEKLTQISTVDKSFEKLEKISRIETSEKKLKSATEENISIMSQKKKKKRNVSNKEDDVTVIRENLNSKKTLEEIIGRHESKTSKNRSDEEKSSSKGTHRELEDIINSNSPLSTNFSLEKWFGNKTSNSDSSPVIKKIKSKRIDTGIVLNSEELPKSGSKKNPTSLPKLTTSTERLNAFLDKKIAEFEEELDHEESSYESSDQEDNIFLDDMAEEGEEDTPSEDSNAIIDEGDAINTDSERSEDDDDENDSSFICDDEDNELLPGDEYDLEVEQTGKKSRILNVEDRNEDVIKIKRKPEPEPKKRKSRIIKMENSSDSEEDLIDLTKEDELTVENTSLIKNRLSTESAQKGRKSSITIIENINVKEIKDTDLSNRINQLVDTFCTNIPQKGGVSMNLSLEYAGHSSPEQPGKSKKNKSKLNKRGSGIKEETVKKLKEPQLSVSLNENVTNVEQSHNVSLDIAKSASDPPKKSKGKKRKSSTEEETVPCKQPNLIEKVSEELENDTSKKSKKKRSRNKRKRNNEEKLEQDKQLNISSSEDNTEVKKKKRKKSNKSKRTEEKTSKNIPSTSSNYLDLQRETYGLMNQLVTDVKNRSRRTVRPSTATDKEENWSIELDVEMKPSTSAVTKKEMKDFKKYHAKDFRNQMLFNSGRVNRVETTKMLQKKGAYN